jgi:hypothetical protein
VIEEEIVEEAITEVLDEPTEGSELAKGSELAEGSAPEEGVVLVTAEEDSLSEEELCERRQIIEALILTAEEPISG